MSDTTKPTKKPIKKPVKKPIKKIATRNNINTQDTWDLNPLFCDAKSWNKKLTQTTQAFKKFSLYENTLKENDNYILQILHEYYSLSEQATQLAAYAMLCYSSDISSTQNQELYGKLNSAVLIFSQCSTFFNEELLSLNKSFLNSLCKNPKYINYKQQLKKIIRKKPHTLSKAEEKLLANQVEYRSGFQKSFEALTNADMKFGTVDTPEGQIELSHSTLTVLLEHKDRHVRKTAYEQYFNVYHSHLNVLTALYSSNVQQDNAHAKIRNYNSALSAALHSDNIPNSLYTMLIDTANKNLKELHHYYCVLKKITGLKDFSSFDTSYCPITLDKPINISYEKAVDILKIALSPLGTEYVDVLVSGLLKNRWVDRYENVGKRSGAFSYPIYNAPQYIMMNYQSKSIHSMFTLAHEGGHSMHSYLSAQNNAYPNFHYSIFAAEIASTLNEHLLYKHLINTAKNTQEKLFYLWHKAKAFVSTFFRQTMFAEFENVIHTFSTDGVPLTSNLFLSEYTKLNQKYHGVAVSTSDKNNVTGLRIPHFYHSYYVYQYATGVAIATSLGEDIYNSFNKHHTNNQLANKINSTINSTINSKINNKTSTNTAQKIQDKYLTFLKSGGSLFPLDALRLTGIDFSTSKVITDAITSFKNDVILLDSLT